MATPTFEIWVWQGSASYQGSLTVPSHLKVKDLIDRAIEEVCHESVFLQDSLDPWSCEVFLAEDDGRPNEDLPAILQELPIGALNFRELALIFPEKEELKAAINDS